MPISANGNDRSITRQRKDPGCVATVSAYLIPGAAVPLVNPCEAFSGSNGNGVAITGERDVPAKSFMEDCSIDITAALHPVSAIPVVDACVARIDIVIVVVGYGANRNRVAVAGERKAGKGAQITRGFSVDVTAALNPVSAIPVVDACMT